MSDKIQFDYHLNPGTDVEAGNAKYHVRINKNRIVTDKEISEYLEHVCTLTQADIAAVLVGLRSAVVDALTHGDVVSLDGICKIEPILGVKGGECKGTEDGSQIVLKNVRLHPFKSLVDDVRNGLKPCTRRKGKHSTPFTQQELYDKLVEFFKSHDTITRRDLENLFGLTRYMATKFIRQFVEDGKLLRPRNTYDSEYRPAAGCFGTGADGK